MGRAGTAIICISTVVTVVAGCGHSSSTSSATSTNTAPPAVATGPAGLTQLRTMYEQAVTTKKSAKVITRTNVEGDPDIHTQTCSVRYYPSVASDCVATRDNEQSHTITTPGAIYLSVPLAARQPGDKPWQKFDSYRNDAPSSDVVQTLAQAPGSDDSVLADGVATVTATAPDHIDGQPTTRCALDVDLAAMYRSEAGRTTDPKVKQLLLTMAAGSSGTAKSMIWIGRDNLPAQLMLTLPQPNTGQGATKTSTMTISYRDWGVPVTVTPPPADQVSAPH